MTAHNNNLRRSPGVSRQLSAASRKPPDFAGDDERLVYHAAPQLLQDKRIDDATWSAVIALLGEQSVVDLTGIVGHYTVLAIVMNGAPTSPRRASSKACLLSTEPRDGAVHPQEFSLPARACAPAKRPGSMCGCNVR